MTYHPSPRDLFDVAVVGPGHIGASAALAFAKQGHRTALIGPARGRSDGRTVAMMDASWRFLEMLGVTPRLESHAAPLTRMRLVDDTGSLFVRPPTEFRASELGLDQFGWNVEAATLSYELLQTVADEPLITRLDGTVKSVAIDAAAATITLADGSLVRTRLVVGADGRHSAIRDSAGIGTKTWQYPQSALTTIVRHTRPHRDVSTEFHTRSGPCTTVPLPGQRSSIVWMVKTDEGERLMALDDAALAHAIEERTHSILGALTIDGPRGLVPMSGLGVERYTATRLALVGEAAHVFPPIGAQGLNLGIRDAMALVDSVNKGDPGAPDGLAVYERGRARDVPTRTRAVDALNRSLLSDILPVDFARGFGLLALETIAPLRKFVMQQGLSPQSH